MNAVPPISINGVALSADDASRVVAAVKQMLGQCRNTVDEYRRDEAYESSYGDPDKAAMARELLAIAEATRDDWQALVGKLTP